MLAVARFELRRRWAGLLALGLLVGLVGGVALGATVLGLRTVTAYPRLVEAVGLDDARVLVPADQPALAAAVPGLPGVVGGRSAPGWIAQLDGSDVEFFSLQAVTGPVSEVLRPVLIDGRVPDAADELLIGEPFAAEHGLGVGDEVAFRLRTPQEIVRFDVGYAEPSQPLLRARVVGMGRLPEWTGMVPQVMAGPGFAVEHTDVAAVRAQFLRLSPGTGTIFTDAYRAAAAAQPEPLLARYLPPIVELPTAGDPMQRASARVLGTGFALFAGVLGLGVLLVVGQALARRYGRDRATQHVETALGMTSAQRIGARVLAAAPAAVTAGAVAAVLGTAAGVLEPLGDQARYEPAPGFRPEPVIALGGAAVLAALFLLLVAGAAAWAARRRTDRVPLGSRAPVLRRWPAVSTGVGLAWRRGPGGGVAILGVTVAVAGVVAAATFGASLTRLVDEPARYGQGADLAVVDAREPDVAALVADPRILAVDVARTAGIELVDGTRVETTARTHRSGALAAHTPAGRVPDRAGEIALGPRLAARLGLGVGDTVTARAPDGTPVPLSVTGIVVAAPDNPDDQRGVLGEIAQVTAPQLAALGTTEPLVTAYLQTRPGEQAAVLADLSQRLDVVGRGAPPGIRNLDDLRALPDLLAVLLGLVGAAALTHVVGGLARHGGPALDVLGALGAAPAQVRTAVAAMGAAVVVPAVLGGALVGLGTARVVWWEVATATGVAGDVDVPVTLLVVIGPAALLTALAAAAVAWSGRRVAPGVRAIEWWWEGQQGR